MKILSSFYVPGELELAMVSAEMETLLASAQKKPDETLENRIRALAGRVVSKGRAPASKSSSKHTRAVMRLAKRSAA